MFGSFLYLDTDVSRLYNNAYVKDAPKKRGTDAKTDDIFPEIIRKMSLFRKTVRLPKLFLCMLTDRETAGEEFMFAYNRQEAVQTLLKSYASCYDITEFGAEQAPFVAECRYNAENSSYFLIRSAKMWSANSFEYLYLISLDHLSLSAYQEIEKKAYEMGMAQIKPGKDHMYSFITPVILCDSADPEAVRACKRCRIHKSFHFSLHGWMDFHTVLVTFGDGRVVSNMGGTDAAKFMKKALAPKK